MSETFAGYTDEQLRVLMTSPWAGIATKRFENPIPLSRRGTTFSAQRREDTGPVIVKYVQEEEAARYRDLAQLSICPPVLECTTLDGGLELQLEQAQGTLAHFFPTTEEERRRAMQKITHLVALLEEYGISHCDIKPTNILVAPKQTYLLSDFGSSRTHREYQRMLKQEAGIREGRRVIHGTPGYIPPEQYHAHEICADLPQKEIPVRHDSFSLGMLYACMYTRIQPHFFLGLTRQEIANAFLKDGYKDTIRHALPITTEPVVTHIILEAISPNPYDRPSVAELKAKVDRL